MAEPLNPNETVTIEELAISSMWEMAALVEVLERKGVLTGQEALEMIEEVRPRTPRAEPLDEAQQDSFPEPYLVTEPEKALIEQVFQLFNATD